jgi:DNA-directed RNA polymerase specialized sigma24 family protein
MWSIHRFRPVGGGMMAWLIRIARNAHSDAMRQQRRRGTEVAGGLHALKEAYSAD